MEATGFSILTAIIFIPIIAGVVILFLDRKNRDLVRGVGVTAAQQYWHCPWPSSSVTTIL